MDKSTLRHRLSVAPWDETQYHVFVRTDDGEVEHYWAGDGVMFGPELLGGHFDTDPVAAWEFQASVTRLHLIGRSGIQLLHWHWDEPSGPGLLGAPAAENLPGYCLADPEVIGIRGRLDVFATALEGTIRHWWTGPDGAWAGPESLGRDIADSQPVAVSRADGSFDVFALGDTLGDGPGLRHWWNAADGWHSEARSQSDAGRNLIGRPTAVSYAEQRLDIFAVRADGVPVHWGWNGRWFDDEVRLGLTFPAITTPAHVGPDPQLVSSDVNRLTLLGRTVDPATSQPLHLFEWHLDPPSGWPGPNDLGPCPTPAAVWSSATGRVDILTRNPDGSFSHQFFVEDDSVSIDGSPNGSWGSEALTLAEPELPPVSFTPAPVNPDLLLLRREDMVVLGVQWTGFDLQAGTSSSPAQVVAAADAELTVIFPPQHVAEEVVGTDGPAVPPTDPASTGGFPTWPASCSGASRVVLGGFEPGDRVDLTAEGVIDAVRRGSVIPATDPTEGKTQIELPYRLVISPYTNNNEPVRCGHPATAVAGPSGSVGLWNTRIAADGNLPGTPAGMLLRPLQADSSDPFPIPLPGGARARILLAEPSARIDRLALSALGGSLTASGSWPGFTWDHDAALGRDRTVRTAVSGVLFPFGHRAEYVELTERRFESTADGATAHLRKKMVLTVTESARGESTDAGLARAFPFSSVRLERTVYEELAAPEWVSKPMPPPAQQDLEENLGQWQAEAKPLKITVDGGDMGPPPGAPPVEDIAANESLSSPRIAQAALDYLAAEAGILHVQDQIDALQSGGPVPLDVFFVPKTASGPVQFPVCLTGALGDVHVLLPLVFVAGIDLPAGLLHPSFSPFTDGEMLSKIASAYGDGIAEVGGTRIDMVRAADRKDADVCEVQRLHIVGVPADGGFRPRLGAVPAPGETSKPAADRWAFEMALPAMRTLLGGGTPGGSTAADQPLRVALTRALLNGAPDLDIPFQVPDGAAALVTDFASNTARSGGMLAPDFVADGISRLHGPVNVEAMAAQLASGPLDPAKLLNQTANLLGFSLADLIDKAALTKPLEILSAAEAGQPPKVTMTWDTVKLTTTSGQFVTTAQSTFDLKVELGVTGQSVDCTVQQVGLALPDQAEAAKLLEVDFEQLQFTQAGSKAPALKVTHPSAQFFGFLNLLKKLQDAVDLHNSGAKIDASSKGVSVTYDLPVPDVTTGGFQLTGLRFHAGIDVPFDGRLVTIDFAFASREDPFNVSVLALGGGGYVDFLIDKTGLRRIELSLEFGASIAVNFVVASGEVHAMGGVRLIKDGDAFSLTGYLRFGGSVEILGLISVSVELVVTLRYEGGTKNEMIGRATLVLEIDLTLFSHSVELDTGDWVLAGGDTHAAAEPLLLEQGVPGSWLEYRAAFDVEPTV